MEKAVEQYCKNIEQFILNNADSKKYQTSKYILKTRQKLYTAYL